MIFWLSLCDPERPAGTQFLGAAIVPATNILEAASAAHMLGCNPGGEVAGHEIPEDVESRIAAKWRSRLLTRAECEEFDRELLGGLS